MPQVVNSQVSIANMSLHHLAVGKQIASFTEKSEEARTCALFYDQCVGETLEAFAWPFATKTVSLALVQQQPTYEWGWSYRLPDDCLAARRILNGSINVTPFPDVFNTPQPWPMFSSRIMTAQSRIPYRIMADDAGGLLWTDCPPVPAVPATANALAQPALPQLEYTAEQDTPAFYSAAFSQAVAFLLASYIAPSLTGGDKFNLGAKAFQRWGIAISQAQANAGNEEQPDQPAESEAIRMRF